MTPLGEQAIFTTGKLPEKPAPVKGDRPIQLSKRKDGRLVQVAFRDQATTVSDTFWQVDTGARLEPVSDTGSSFDANSQSRRVSDTRQRASMARMT